MQTRRAVTLGLTSMLLGACAPRLAPQAPAAEQLATPQIRPPRFSDAKPHPWDGQHPRDLPVHGIDVARWQSQIDWHQARDSGVNFAFIKATEGADGTHVNPEFERQWQGARAAGVPRGAYHLYYWCAPPEAQARHFIETVPSRAGDLPPVLDLEWNPYSPSCQLRPSPTEVKEIVRRYSAVIAQHYGQAPILYMTVDFHADTRSAGWHGWDLWLRSVAAPVQKAHQRNDHRFWQYSGTGLVPGITGHVDLNAFAGSEADWARWLALRRIRASG